MLADGKVYEQSLNLIIKAANYYYIESMSQSEIAKKLDISMSTVSRLLKKAREMGVVRFDIHDTFMDCLKMEKLLCRHFNLKEVIIAPNRNLIADVNQIKKDVALEGARYIQRVLCENDVLGIAWGRTMYYLIQYLNPSQKINIDFVTLNGNLSCIDKALDANYLVHRMAMAFGGTKHSLYCDGLQPSKEIANKVKSDEHIKSVFKWFDRVTISVSGIGSLYPDLDSPLGKDNYLNNNEINAIRRLNVYGDLILRFFDGLGQECKSDLVDRTIAIDMDIYKRIPTKIIVASGSWKADTVLAGLKGDLINVLILDEYLAKAICEKAQLKLSVI
jgi:Transcriptional regulator, contains sigma factor-related N-terminal domain